MTELSVVLVSYNDWTHLEKCLQSLIPVLPESEMEIVIVDNNSSDGSPDFIKNQFPEIHLIAGSENVGFARACNLGASVSTGEFILFLNTDTIVNVQAVGALMDELRRNPKIGAVGPALLTGQKSYQVSFGKKVDFFFELFQKGFLNLYYAKKLKSDDRVRDVGWLSAACLLVRREAFNDSEYFDENYFLYFEDIDLCYQLKRAGWVLQFCPFAQITHIGGTSTSSAQSASRYHYRRSQIYFYRKHNSRMSQNLLRLYLLLNTFISFPPWRRGEADYGRKQFLQLLGRQDP